MADTKKMNRVNRGILAGLGLAALAGAGYMAYTNHVADPEVEVQMSGSLRNGFTCRIRQDYGFAGVNMRLYNVTYDASTGESREGMSDYGNILGGDPVISLIDDYPSDGLVDSVILHGMQVEDPLMGESWGVATEYSVGGSPELTAHQRRLASEAMAKWRTILKVEERCLAEDRD